MTRLPFGRTARLVNTRSSERREFRIGLESIEKSTGRLVDVGDVEYESDGVSFEPGDVLFGKLRPNLAKAWRADRSGDAVGDFHVYRPIPQRMTSRYLSYLVLSEPFLGPVVAAVQGAKMPRADWDTVRKVEVYAPKLVEQRAIAEYLDRETAQIDAFIAKNAELIDLLVERRRSFIAESVTRGMAGSAALKSTEISWLGSVPAHWDVVRARYLCTVGTGSGDTVDAVDDGEFPFYVRSDVPERSNRYDFESKAVLTSGDGAGVGKVFHLVEGKFAAHQRVYVMRNFRLVTAEFFYLYFSSFFGVVALDGSAKSTVDSVRRHMITDMPITVPPVEEQAAIAIAVADRTRTVDRALDAARRSVELARERRAALISAAVTGKIDVGVKV